MALARLRQSSTRWAAAATIVTPFLVVDAVRSRGVAGVMALMVGLLLVQIVTVGRSASSRASQPEELKGRRARASAGESR